MKSQHEEALRAFLEYTLMQRVLIQQVVAAINPKYISALRNHVTGQLLPNVCLIFLYFFRIYSKIRSEFLQKKKTIVKTKTYNINEPIDSIFNKIECSAKLGELSGKPFTESQLIDFDFIIINKCRAFRSNICDWMRRPIYKKKLHQLQIPFH